MKTCPRCRNHYPDALDFCPRDGSALPKDPPGPGEGPASDPLVGAVIDGRYRLEYVLGEGGMGVVYGARHVLIDKRVAVKVLKKEALSDGTAAQRFIQEARSASKIGHANIVDITDFGTLLGGGAYFVMEFLEGRTLGELLDDGPLTPRRAIHIAAQIARGLNAAHRQGVVHRDLKPDNVFLIERDGQADQVKIVDFGIAKVQGASRRLTQTGMVLGTPEYMAPEQATGKDTDHRVDEYALGCMLYEMLTGEVPFLGANASATLTKQVFEPVVPPRARFPALAIPLRIEEVTLRAMAKKPDERYPSMRELLAALDEAGAELGDEAAGVRSTPRLMPISDLPKPRALILDDLDEEYAAEVRGDDADEVQTTQVGALEVPRRSRVPLYAGLAVCLLLGVGGFALLRRADGAARSMGASDLATSTTKPAALSPREPSHGGVAVPQVRLSLSSDPAGAVVWAGAEKLGVTPLVYSHARSDRPLELVFRLTGYGDVKRTLPLDGDRDLAVVFVRPRSMSPSVPASPRPPLSKPPSPPPEPGAADDGAELGRLHELRNPF